VTAGVARAGGPPGRVPSAAELAALVLPKTWPERGTPGPAWRSRVADEAVLLIELCRWLEGCHRHGGPVRPPPGTVVELFADLARHRAPRQPVRRFVTAVVGHVHAELATPARAAADTELLLELLERCYRDAARPDAARPGRIWAHRDPHRAPGGPGSHPALR